MDEIRVLSVALPCGVPARPNRNFSGGNSVKSPPCYHLWLRNQLDSLFIALTTVQDCIPVFSQGGQGQRVQLTVREPSIKGGWRDAPLAFRDLAVSNMHDINYGR